MAPEGAQKVFGFDCGLDWRPTVFVNGIPSNRVCSGCGLVPSNIGLLPCRHVLCQPCYDRCVSNGSRCCLDGEGILPDDVLWSPISAGSILERKIQCWNAPHGCGVTGPASEVLHHFNSECQHHTVTCLRCRGSVAHKDIVSHLESRVCSHTPGTESAIGGNVVSGTMRIANALGNLDTKVSLLQRSFEENLKPISSSLQMLAQRIPPQLPTVESIQCMANTLTESAELCRRAVDQMAGAQAALRNDIGAIMGFLQGVSNEVGDLKELLKHNFELKSNETLAVCTNSKHSTDRLERACAAEHKEIREKLAAVETVMRDCLETKPPSRNSLEQCQDDVSGKRSITESVSNLPLERRLNVSETLEWSIESWSECKGKYDVLVYSPNPGYFYGYHIRPFGVLTFDGGYNCLKVGFEICRGECDKLLEWPMNKILCLTPLHPTKSGTFKSILACPAGEDALYDYCMPVGRPRVPKRYAGSIDVRTLEESGYIKDDKMLLRFEVLKCTRQW